VLDSPAYRTALANQTGWSKANIARFRNMIRAVARITISRGQGRGAALGIVRLRPADKDRLRTALRINSTPETGRNRLDASARKRSSAVQTDHRQSLGPQSGAGDWFVLIDGTDLNAVSAAIAARLGDAAIKSAVISIGLYLLMWDLAKSDLPVI